MKANKSFVSGIHPVALTITLGLRSLLIPALSIGLLTGLPLSYALAAPPQMPEQFDKGAVEQLIANIDREQNATILKFGYFLRRNPQGFPVKEGLALLKSAIATEVVGSKRWFILQEILGFAGLHSGTGNSTEGVKAYKSLFSQAKMAKPAGTSDVLLRAIREFVVTKPNSFGNNIQGQLGRETTLLALNAFLEHLKVSPETEYRYRWAKTIDLTYSNADAMAMVQKVLDDPTTPKSYAMLRTAADVFEVSNPQQSINLLLQAKPLLPKPEGQDFKEARAFYNLLVMQLDSQGRTKEAILIQKELVALTKQDEGQLAILYINDNDMNAATPLLAELARRGSDKEVVETAGELLYLGKENPDVKENIEASKRLYGDYLSAERPRVIEYELLARLKFGTYLMTSGKKAEAVAILSAPYPQPLPSRIAQSYYSDIQNLLKGKPMNSVAGKTDTKKNER